MNAETKTAAPVTGRERLIEIAEWLEAGGDARGTVAGFNMSDWRNVTNCGSVCCIAGALVEFEAQRTGATVAHVLASVGGGFHQTGEYLAEMDFNSAYDLFIPPEELNFGRITPDEAAATVRGYLETGDVSWDHVNHNA